MLQAGEVLAGKYRIVRMIGKGGSAGEVDHRTDLWAVGVIAYEALTGRRPFVADGFRELMAEVLTARPRRPRELRPELPEELERAVLTALAKSKDERFGTAGEMLAALFPFVDERAVGHLALGKLAGISADALRRRPAEAEGGRDRAAGQPVLDDGDTLRDQEPPHRAAPDDGAASEAASPRGEAAPASTASTVRVGASTDLAWPSQQGGRPAGGRRRGPIVAAGLAAVLLVGGGLAWLLGAGAGREASSPVVTSVSHAPGPEVAAVPSAGAPRPAEPPEVVVSLTGVPETARVLLDGEPVDGHELRRPPSAEPHELRVEHRGFEPWTTTLSFEREATVAVTLTPTATGPEGRPSKATGRADRRGGEPRGGGGAAEPRPEQPSRTRTDEQAPPPPPPPAEKRPRELEPDPRNPYGAR